MCYLTLVAGVPLSLALMALRLVLVLGRLQESQQSNVADDFGYIGLDKGKRKLVNVVEGSKHNVETSHAQRPKQ